MKIQFSNTRIVKDAMTVWYEAGEDVDVVMDLKNLTFRAGSIETIYAFHVLDHFFPKEAQDALKNWRACLKSGGQLYIVVDDFELIVRSFISGDFSVDFFNENFSHPMYFTKDNLIDAVVSAGFNEGKTNIWFADIPDQFKKEKYELVFQTTNE